MDREQTLAARVAAEQPPQRVKRKVEPNKLIGVALGAAVFVGFAWFVLSDDGRAKQSGVRVDAFQRDSGDRYGLLTARGPAAADAEQNDLLEEIAVATPEAAPVRVDSEGLRQAILTIEKQGDRIAELQDELTEARVSLEVKDSEIAALKGSNERLNTSFAAREKKFQSELARAIADAEARALESMSHLQSEGLTEDERRRLEELKRLRQRQNQSDGIVFDENPYGRN